MIGRSMGPSRLASYEMRVRGIAARRTMMLLTRFLEIMAGMYVLRPPSLRRARLGEMRLWQRSSRSRSTEGLWCIGGGYQHFGAARRVSTP